MTDLTVCLGNLDAAKNVHSSIPEFKDTPDYLDDFSNRCDAGDDLIIIGEVDNSPAGYMVAYPKDNTTLYCWMGGVIPSFRENGLYSKMSEYRETVAKSRNFSKLEIKTRNRNRNILAFLVKDGWSFIAVDSKDDITQNRVLLEKDLTKDLYSNL